MEKEMTGADRRKKLIFLMRESEQPLSGTQLGPVSYTHLTLPTILLV